MLVLAIVALASSPAPPQTIVLDGPATSVTIDADHPAVLTSALDKATGTEFIRSDHREAHLFMIHLRTPEGEVVYAGPRATQNREFRPIDEQTVEIGFPHLREGIGAVIRFWGPDNQGLFHGRIRVTNRTDLTIFRVDFPFFACPLPIGTSPDDDRVFLPISYGRVLSHLQEQSQGVEYPGHCSMQCMGYYDHDAGLYIAAQDGAGHAKRLAYWVPKAGEGPAGCLVTQVQHQMGEVPGAGYDCEYDVVFGTFRGDWQQIATIYKPWAVKQRWVPERLSQRTDIPDWVKEPFAANGVWIKRCYAQKGETPGVTRLPETPLPAVPELARDYAAEVGLPLVMFVGGWEKHGTCMTPDLLPPVGGNRMMRDATRQMRRDGNRFFIFHPGIKWTLRHSLQFYDGRESFERDARPHAIKNRDGSVWTRGVSGESFDGEYANLCISTPKVRETMAGVCAELAALGVDVAAFDQMVGGAHPACYDPSHDHPPGRGRWIYEHTREVFRLTRKLAKARNPDFALTLEWPTELYLADLDIWTQEYETLASQRGKPGWNEPVPALGMVYHEYSPSLCFTDVHDWGSFQWQSAAKNAVALVRGWVPFPYSPIEGPAHAESAGLRMWAKCSQAMATYARPYCYFGEMLKAPVLETETVHEYFWDNERNARQDISLPAVIHSAWRAADGSVGVLLVNLSGRMQDAMLHIPDYFGYGTGTLRTLRDGVEEGMREDTALPATIRLSLKQADILLVSARR